MCAGVAAPPILPPLPCAGYFTSRPASKGYIRSATSYLQAARQLESFMGLPAVEGGGWRAWQRRCGSQHVHLPHLLVGGRPRSVSCKLGPPSCLPPSCRLQGPPPMPWRRR